MNRKSLSSSDFKGPFSATKLWNEVVDQMKNNVTVKKRRWRMKVYEDAFVASEALDWLHGYLKENLNFGADVSRQQAIQLCEKFLKNGIIADVRGKQYNAAFEDNNHLYKFIKNVRYSPYRTRSRKSETSTQLNSLGKNESSGIADTKASKSQGIPNLIFNEEASSDELQDEERPLLKVNATPVVKGRRSLSSRSTPFTTAPSRTPLVNKLNVLSASCPRNDQQSRSLLKTGEKRKRHIQKSDLKDVIMNPAAFVAHNQRTLSDKEVSQVWWNIATTRLKRLMDLSDTFTSSLKVEGYDNGCVWVNAQNQKFPKAIEVLPQWLISAMKCLINWPNREDCSTDSFPNYAGFERDVFKAVLEFFNNHQECPLIPGHLIAIFRKTVDFLFTCKVTAMRSLQYCCLLIPPKSRELLQVLFKFMVRLSENHIISLSDDLPIKEMLIQSFSYAIFGVKADMDVIRLMYFMIEKFPEHFTNPDGLQFQVEQRLLFLKNCRENKFTAWPGGTAFCERVTPQEYKEQSLITSQRSLRDLLTNIIDDESMNEKQRKKQLKQFEKSYPDIYQARFPGDNLSTCSQRSEKLRQVMKPLKILKNLR